MTVSLDFMMLFCGWPIYVCKRVLNKDSATIIT